MDSVFTVIDNETGNEISERETERIAKEAGLMMADIDQFAVCEDGQIILLDDCGNTAYLDMKRFEARWEVKK